MDSSHSAPQIAKFPYGPRPHANYAQVVVVDDNEMLILDTNAMLPNEDDEIVVYFVRKTGDDEAHRELIEHMMKPGDTVEEFGMVVTLIEYDRLPGRFTGFVNFEVRLRLPR